MTFADVHRSVSCARRILSQVLCGTWSILYVMLLFDVDGADECHSMGRVADIQSRVSAVTCSPNSIRETAVFLRPSIAFRPRPITTGLLPLDSLLSASRPKPWNAHQSSSLAALPLDNPNASAQDAGLTQSKYLLSPFPFNMLVLFMCARRTRPR